MFICTLFYFFIFLWLFPFGVYIPINRPIQNRRGHTFYRSTCCSNVPKVFQKKKAIKVKTRKFTITAAVIAYFNDRFSNNSEYFLNVAVSSVCIFERFRETRTVRLGHFLRPRLCLQNKKKKKK